MNYAYLDDNNTLRITTYKSVAMQLSKNKKYICTDFPALYGYPIDEDEKIIILYSENKERKNKPIPQELADLYIQLSQKL